PVKPAHSPQHTLTGLRVLCLDNDVEILMGMEALLSNWGVEVIAATTIDEALEKMALKPQVLLVDYHLHDRLDGLDSLDTLREHARHLHGALLTADGSEELKKKARQRGYLVLTKPVRPAALRDFLTAHHHNSKPVPLSFVGKLNCLAISTAWVRLVTPSLRKIAVMWVLMVASVTPSSCAICLFNKPVLTICSTRNCCGVKVCSKAAAALSSSATGAAECAASGAQISPISTVSKASPKVFVSADFGTNPMAPWSSARRMSSGCSWADTIITGNIG